MRQPPLPDDPDALRGPGGLTLREVHERVRESVERDEATHRRNAVQRKGYVPRLTAWWQRLRGRRGAQAD